MRRIVGQLVISFLLVGFAFAADLGSIALSITDSFESVGKLMIALAYLSGIGFGISAVFKFKQHKDNPTQIPIGTPFALFGVSCALIFLPGIYQPAGNTIFGKDSAARAGGFHGDGAMIMPGSSYAYSNHNF